MSDVRVYVSQTGKQSHRVLLESPPEALSAMARVAAAARRKVEPCHCEHEDHFTGKAHPHMGVPANEFVAQYVGKICAVCAVFCLPDFLIHQD